MADELKPPPGYEPVNSQPRTFSRNILQPPPGYEPIESNSQLPGASTEKVSADFYGKMLAQAPPMIGDKLIPGGPGAALGSIVSQGMKAAAPGFFGEPPGDFPAYLKAIGSDVAINSLLPGALGWAGKKIVGALPAVKEGTANLLTKNIQSQLAGRPESEILTDAANQYTPGVSVSKYPQFPNIPKTPGGAALENNEVGQALQKFKAESQLPLDEAKTVGVRKLSDKIFSDVNHIQNAKLVADPTTVAELGYRRLLGEGPINAGGILKELGGEKSEIYAEAFGQNLSTFKEALSEIAKQQNGGIANTMIRYAGHHLIWTGLSGGAALTGHPMAAVAAGGMALSGPVFSKLMSSEYAPVVVAALKTPAGSPQAAVINEFMSAAIKSLGNAGVAAAKD